MPDKPEGKAKGGFARAEVLSPAERREIAKKAAEARWGDKPLPRATHSGVIEIGKAKIPVFVLEDGTRVVSQRGMQKTIGMSTSGGTGGAHRTAQIMETIEGKLNISSELSVRMRDPLFFLPPSGGKQGYGYEATTLIDACELLLRARDVGGVLMPKQEKYAIAADIVIRSFAKVGIVALVDEATGYQGVRPKDALQKYLEKIIRKELAAWAKKFPDEFYENIYKLKGWPWPGMKKNRYSVVAYYTRDLVYERLAPGLLAELEVKSPKNDKGNRGHKLHQWLTEDIGDPMLAQHLYSLLMFQRLALSSGYGWHRFLKMVDKVMPKKGATLEIPFPETDA
jgi:hypothetical protein